MMRKKAYGKMVAAVTVAAIVMLVIAGAIIMLVHVEPTYAASAASAAGESLSLKVQPVMAKPDAASWLMAWRVGTTQVSTVNIGVQVQPTGTNVVNPRLTYYIKAVAGGSSVKVLSGSLVSVNLGSTFSNSTGSISIDSHLQCLGLSTTCDQTVSYYIYARLEAAGAISGQTLVAEVAETQFTSVTYDYGGLTTVTKTYPITGDSYVNSYYGSANNGGVDPLMIGYDGVAYCRIYIMGNVTDAGTIQNIKLYMYLWQCTPVKYSFTFAVHPATGWTEYGVTWKNQPALSSTKTTCTIDPSTKLQSWIALDITSISPSQAPCIVSACVKEDVEGSAGCYLLIKSRESSYAPYLMVTLQTVNWSLSWAWANQPLSLIAVPVARFMVAGSLAILGLALLMLAALKGQKLAAVAAIAMLLLALYFGGMGGMI